MLVTDFSLLFANVFKRFSSGVSYLRKRQFAVLKVKFILVVFIWQVNLAKFSHNDASPRTSSSTESHAKKHKNGYAANGAA